MTKEITIRQRMTLTSENVQTIFAECLASSQATETITANGIDINVAFDTERINARRDDIIDMLNELPRTFFTGNGDGWTFANMCINANGEQWTDLHRVCDKLLCLGISINAAQFTIKQRDLWRVFPGGLPYITINTFGFNQ